MVMVAKGLSRAAMAVAMRRAVRRGHGEEDAREIEMVPLLDIVTNVMLFLLATIATLFTSSIPVPAPARGEPSTGPEDRLTVSVTDRGYVIAAQGGFLQPDCQHFGAFAVTVPALGGADAPVALTRCLRTMRSVPSLAARFPAAEPVQLAGAGGVNYGDVVAVLDAMRETRPGARDLFPNVRLGIVR